MPSVSGNVGAVASVSSVFGRNGGVVAANGDYSGIVAAHLPGATAATRYVGGTASGAPVAGTFAVGDFVVEQTGKVYVCTVAGTPGTWVAAGGASSVVQTATTTLTDAQIKALPTTSGVAPFGFLFLASPGPSTVILPMAGTLIKYGGAAYTNVDAASFFVVAHSGFNGADMSPRVVGPLLNTTDDEIGFLPLTGWDITSTTPTIFPNGTRGRLQDSSGLGLVLFVDNAGAGDFTGGDAANSLVIQVLYAVLNV